jgi:hypothetical protein
LRRNFIKVLVKQSSEMVPICRRSAEVFHCREKQIWLLFGPREFRKKGERRPITGDTTGHIFVQR